MTALLFFFFFFNDTATTEIYTLSLHDALPICLQLVARVEQVCTDGAQHALRIEHIERSEEHTSELQSPCNLVCRLLLEKKKTSNSQHGPSLHRSSSLRTHSLRNWYIARFSDHI